MCPLASIPLVSDFASRRAISRSHDAWLIPFRWPSARLFSNLIFQQHGVEFGHGILNKGGAKKREKRPLTQIEIMAALEREKTQKKAQRKAAKVREPAD